MSVLMATLKVLYVLLIIWNLLRMVCYIIFASTVRDEDDPNMLELRADLLWAILHAVVIVGLIVAWGMIF